MEHVNKLRVIRPELVEKYESLSHDQLLNQICAEVIDLINMEERVSVFMSECTDNMSKTNYTPESIRQLVNDKNEKDNHEFIKDLVKDLQEEGLHTAATYIRINYLP